MSREIEMPNLDDLILRYQSGTSLKQLSNESGYGRNVLFRRFSMRGIPIRGRSEAERLKWRSLSMDRNLVERQCRAAWEKSRGRIVPAETKIRHARTMAERFSHVGKYERELHDLLRVRGIPAQMQYRIGFYNVDLAVCPFRVAVEVQCAYINGGKSVRRERLEYLFDAGWAVLILHPRTRLYGPDLARLTEQIITFCETTGRQPTIRRQYGVIGSHGQPVAKRGFQFDGWARVPGF